MNVHSRSLASFAALALGLALAAVRPAAAQTVSPSGASHIAIINVEQAISETAAGKKAVADLQTRFAPRQAALQKQQQQIEALQKQLSAQSNTMSDAAKSSLASEIQTQQRDLQQGAQNLQSDVQDGQTLILNDFGPKMKALIASYAKSHGDSAVLDVSQSWPQNSILYFNPALDITATIVKLYDQANPVAAK